jgi:hypothetical protein
MSNPLWRLLDDNTSIERAYFEINNFNDRAANSTVEALAFELRTGVESLRNPSTQQRLRRLSETQARDLAEHLRKLKPPWKLDAIEVLLTIWSKHHYER